MRVSSCCLFVVLSTLGVAFDQDTNFPTGPQYLMNSDSVRNGSPLFLHPISTPTMSLTDPPVEVGASNATGVLIAGADNQTVVPSSSDALPSIDLFPIFYGEPTASMIEISFPSEPSANLPEGFLDAGVWQMTTAEALREPGYGVSLVEGAAYGRTHTRHATRVYTNADIDRLHSGS